MRVWVPGASGMLGKEVAGQLSLQNIDYLGTDKATADITGEVEIFLLREKITHIINCAAYTKVDQAETDRDAAYRINAAGVQNLGRLSKKYHLPIIHFSTDYVFDGQAAAPYEEGEKTNPLNVYGLTKRAGEICLLEETPHACLIRTSWLFGLQGKNFVQTMLRLMCVKETLSIVSDQVGRPTFAKDLAFFAIKMLNQTGIYHFANSNETSWWAFAKEIHRAGLALGFPFTVKQIMPIPASEYPAPAKRPAYSVLSTGKIEKEFQFNPRTWQNALNEYLHASR